MFDIDYDQYDNLMYSLPNQISLDPNVCLVRNSKFYHRPGVIHNAFSQLVPFREDDYITSGENPNVAYPMNIYLNFNFILDCLQSNMDEKGDVGVYGFISSICTGLNKTLGGINNLEPIIDENENILRIIDSSPIPGVNSSPSQTYSLQLYGYDHKRKRGSTEGFNYTSNFIRDINLKTAITPEYATMITIGATGGGYVKGTEATAFSRWNTGLRDRFKEDFIPSNPVSLLKPDGVDEAETNYVEKFLNKTFECYGYAANNRGFIGSDIKSDAISSNISVVTEYYKYLQSKNKLSGGGNIIGFIPFKLGLTMDGLSGIKIYNKINVNTEFMPSNYGESLDLIVTGVSHKLQNNDWETEIEATVIPKTTKSIPLKIDYTAVEQTVEQTVEAINPLPSTSPNYKPLSSDDDLWIYLSWQQGLGGAAQHYRVATGKRKSYGIEVDAIIKNWPGKKVASNGVNKQNIRTLYKTDQKKLAVGFIDVWRQRYKEVIEKALPLINSKGKNRSGVPYSKIKQTFQKYEIPSKGITWEKLARFGYIENGLNTDDETDTTFQGMFQINKNYKKNPDNVTILNSSRKGQGHKKGFTEYDLDKYIGPLVPRIANKLEDFKKESGYPN